MTHRRLFIGSAVGMLFGVHAVSLAQPAVKLPQIGILANTESPAWDGFRRGLREMGYIDGRNVALVWRWADGKADRYPALAVELVQLKVDLVVTSSTLATLAAKQATSTIPILMLNSAYPDRIGLVESLARPGGNITGYGNMSGEIMSKKLQLIKEVVPKAARVALLSNPTSPIELIASREMQAAGGVLGLEVQQIEVRAPDDHPAAFQFVVASRADAMHVAVNPVNAKNTQLIVDFALKNKLPTSFEERSFVVAGGLFSYGSSFIDGYTRAAGYVDKILKGAKPAELPIQQATKLELVINLRTAKAIGLTIPQALLLRADEVIE